MTDSCFKHLLPFPGLCIYNGNVVSDRPDLRDTMVLAAAPADASRPRVQVETPAPPVPPVAAIGKETSAGSSTRRELPIFLCKTNELCSTGEL